MGEYSFGNNDMALTLEAREDHVIIKREILGGPRFAFFKSHPLLLSGHMFRVVVGLSKLTYHEEDTSIYFWKASSHAIDRLCTSFIIIKLCGSR